MKGGYFMKHNFKKAYIKKALLFDLALLIGLVVSIIISTAHFESTCESVRDSVLRLHVIANSDSPRDQELKLKVRDTLLSAGAKLFSGEVTADGAKNTAESELETLEDAAKSILEENGCNDSVKIEVGESYFPTRTYENVTLPAGKYEAVRVIIGSGEGHNWWCVMFPPLCLPAAQGETNLDDVLTSDAIDLVSSDPKYEVRFKLVEWYEWLSDKLKAELA